MEQASAPTFEPTAFAVSVHGHGRPIIFIPAWVSRLGLGRDGRHLDGFESHVLTLAGFAGLPRSRVRWSRRPSASLASYIRAHVLDRLRVIVGHSLGGYLAYALAEAEPDSVGPTIVVDSGAALGGRRPGGEHLGFGKVARDLWANASDDQYPQQIRDTFSEMVTDPEAPDLATVARSDRRAIGGAIYEMFTTDLRPITSRSRCLRSSCSPMAAGRHGARRRRPRSSGRRRAAHQAP